mmetsp:Transcript_36975/g.73180  ORF Transcript_36975/g.73180 Transcript_36975/m.73180 type:complete len:237 (-) Transcript_36975:201-911(-)
MHVSVVGINGEVLASLGVTEAATVLELKKQIFKMTRLLPKEQRLLLGTHVLKPAKSSLEENLVQDGALITLVALPPSKDALIRAVQTDDDPDVGECLRLLSLPHLPSECLNHRDPFSATTLHYAARTGDVSLVVALLDRDDFMEVNAVDCNGDTALCWAVEHKQVEICNLLAQHHRFTSHHMQNDEQETVLEYAERMADHWMTTPAERDGYHMCINAINEGMRAWEVRGVSKTLLE